MTATTLIVIWSSLAIIVFGSVLWVVKDFCGWAAAVGICVGIAMRLGFYALVGYTIYFIFFK